METWQIVALVSGVVLYFTPSTVWSSLINAFKPQVAVPAKVEVVREKDIVVVEQPKKDVVPQPVLSTQDKLVTLVADWEDFSRRCIALNLPEVVTKMDEIFPLLLKVV